MKVFDGLVDDLHLGFDAGRGKHLGNSVRNFLRRKGGIDGLRGINLLLHGFLEFGFCGSQSIC